MVCTDHGGTLDVVQTEFPPCRGVVEAGLLADPAREVARCADTHAPNRGEVLLSVEDQSRVVDASVEVHCKLRHSGNRVADVDERGRAIGGDQQTSDTEVAVEPRVVEYSAVHLDTELLPSHAVCVGSRLDSKAR